MNTFQYARPKTIDEVLALLGAGDAETALLAGGTDLVNAMKEGVAVPARVISLRDVAELRGIEVSGDSVRIGAMASLEEISRHDAVKQHFPALAEAAGGIKSAQLRNAATLGGNLCQRPYSWFYRQGIAAVNGEAVAPRSDNRYEAIFDNNAVYHVHPSSLAPVLIALGAGCIVHGPGGEPGERAVADLFRSPSGPDDHGLALEPGEIVTGVRIPLGGVKNAHYSVKARQCLDWPLVEAAVAFSLEGNSARNVRVVLGQVAPVPWVADAAAQALEGKDITEETAAQAGEAAAQGASPLSRNGYKVQLVKTAVKRAVLAAAGKPVEA